MDGLCVCVCVCVCVCHVDDSLSYIYIVLEKLCIRSFVLFRFVTCLYMMVGFASKQIVWNFFADMLQLIIL